VANNRIHWVSDTLSPGLERFPSKLEAGVALYFEYEESKVQDYMRANAPWTDRTANARQGLFCKAKSTPGNHALVCYHTMPYGIWLEVKNNGQYAIIIPTIQHEGARVMRGLSQLLSKMRAVT
jgi:hypothetical protein